MGEKDYLLRVRFKRAQAFDAVTTGSSVEIRLYQATLGDMAPLGETPFGSVTWSAEDENDVLLKLTFVDPPGVHTFHIWIREDGFQLDRISFVQVIPPQPLQCRGLRKAHVRRN